MWWSKRCLIYPYFCIDWYVWFIHSFPDVEHTNWSSTFDQSLRVIQARMNGTDIRDSSVHWPFKRPTRHDDPVLGASGRRPVSPSGSPTDPPEAASRASAASGKLHAQPVAVVVVTVSPIDRVIRVPGDEAAGWTQTRGWRAVKFDTHHILNVRQNAVTDGGQPC